MLGVPRNASQKEVKKAYYEASQEYIHCNGGGYIPVCFYDN